ncbi:hypothetical protein [Texcoconibacillus texcoconensis]|uniref:Transporter n=1 Tax=Texcoconibacillus texcoconensis TaxID=1095777 RepID=A0A840QKP1_9BACI|nr:hypothetical protein [Texcoconibacillus texcoconensis]MBB5171903.1 hypothetical protein [Texcoconibacillus texcoconensis]
MYPYEQQQPFGESYNNYSIDPSYIEGHDDSQRQFGLFGPFFGGLLGQFGPPGPPPEAPFGPPGPSPGAPFGPPAGPPTTPPPAFSPSQPAEVGVFAVDPGAIRRCMFRYTYVWLTNREQFWFYPVFVGRTSIAGYRWTGFSWVYFGIDLRRISSFQCF